MARRSQDHVHLALEEFQGRPEADGSRTNHQCFGRHGLNKLTVETFSDRCHQFPPRPHDVLREKAVVLNRHLSHCCVSIRFGACWCLDHASTRASAPVAYHLVLLVDLVGVSAGGFAVEARGVT